MLQLQKKWKNLLTRYKMDRPELLAHSIAYFQLLVDTLCQKLTSLLYKHPTDIVSNAFEQLFTVINNTVDQITIGCVVKKMALMHAILHRMQNRQLAELIISTAQKQIKIIIKEDVAIIVQVQPRRREDSITKIKDLVRKLSGSKERSSSIRGKIGIEKQKEKGAVGQLLSKIITPFCLYMMKVVDDFDTFWKIKHSDEIEKVLIWKIVNWSKLLGKIILQINRLGLYFKEDMLSLSIYLNYLICMDISKYYDLLKKYVMKESQRWRAIIQIQTVGQIRENKWAANSELRELKELIYQWIGIKQKLHYVYGSTILQKYMQYFPKPEKFTLVSQNIKEEINIDFILECFLPKKKGKSISRQSSWAGECRVSEQTRQTAGSTQEQKVGVLMFDNLSENVLFDNLSENMFVNKLQGFNFPKSRLSKVQQLQKQKLYEYLEGC